MQMYISGFLLLRFNPFRKVEFTELDRKIVFSAAIFIFTTTAINSLLITYKQSLSQYDESAKTHVGDFLQDQNQTWGVLLKRLFNSKK
jgi:hypothetical protein